MNRLQAEWLRLYLPAGVRDPDAGTALSDGQGQLRALVIEVSKPAEWDALAAVWRGVQDELGLPPPGIAVSGTDGLQLWFSLAETVSATRGAAFLAGLRRRYLAGVAGPRVRLCPDEAAPQCRAALVPSQQPETGNWSAFVAPGLAPVFADTPWLDVPPGIDGQADLLARLECIKPEDFDKALRGLREAAPSPAAPTPQPARPAGDVDPRRFLQQVLNDEGAPLALRVEAAKALLPHTPM
ncbi:hypothetical protein [Piscinibacter sp. HJYY11]|uniref:hypothetical protein n=1 Tax=Piscinibacter sp. HJYY11 TaxID=2801333 RepID=UPI00191CB4BA|nr:hypothetical protein [Piscinibacter sp. HJYY11]MBL0726562.1 hypothetical protein [Piscinibacter sp. HJYY11]